MFDHEKLIAYQKARQVNLKIQQLLKSLRVADPFLKDQLHRAAISIVINIAEGTGRIGKKDRRNFYVISRGSAFECAAILDTFLDSEVIQENLVIQIKNELEEVSRLLSGLILSLDETRPKRAPSKLDSSF